MAFTQFQRMLDIEYVPRPEHDAAMKRIEMLESELMRVKQYLNMVSDYIHG